MTIKLFLRERMRDDLQILALSFLSLEPSESIISLVAFLCAAIRDLVSGLIFFVLIVGFLAFFNIAAPFLYRDTLILRS